MTFGSVCSGIEAATVAWEPLGWQPAWFAEIDPFCCDLLNHRYPDVYNYGDFTEIGSDSSPVDVLCGGTPCQDFSVAGLRAGMDGARGNLTMEFVALTGRIRPRWLVWENVPGVLSIDSGRAFGAFLSGLAKLGYGFAYRVLDAQHFGVPQRRRRVFVVGHLGDWRRAAAVLFERHCLSGYPAPRRKAGQAVAPTISARTKGGGGLGTDFDCDGGLVAEQIAICPTLRAGGNETGGHRPPGTDVDTCESLIPVPILEAGARTGESETFVTHALRGDGFDASEDGTGRGTPLVPVALAFRACGQDGFTPGDVAPPLCNTDGGGTVPTIAFTCKDHGQDAGEISPTLRGMGHDQSHANAGGQVAVALPETLRYNGINHASTQETHTGKILRTLREKVGEKAFAEWGLGVLDSLQSAEVLQPDLHGQGVRRTSGEGRPTVGDGALPCTQDLPEWVVFALRKTQGIGRSSQERELAGQLTRELGAHLSQLPQPTSQRQEFLFGMWQASQGLGVLRQALSTVQEIRRSAADEGKPAHSAYAVRRLTPREAERLQGFPDDYTLIPRKNGKLAADGPRYKAIGNSMAVPVMAWIGRRIMEVRDA